jgi:hypothetical protein
LSTGLLSRFLISRIREEAAPARNCRPKKRADAAGLAGCIRPATFDTAARQLKFSIAKKGVDLRRKDLALEPRLYRFTFGQAAIVVRIDSLAERGARPPSGGW